MPATRFQGKIISWDDARGFGFVQWNGAQDRLFVHISACPPRRRPQLGDIVSYEVAARSDGRPEARRLAYADEAHRRSSTGSVRGDRGRGGLIMAMVVLAVAVGLWHLWKQAGPKGERSMPLDASERIDPGPPQFSCTAGRTRCSQMTSCEEATFYLKNCPGVEMDGDGDGVPCEQQWCG